jgi:glycosyltransferase involved in cell wall biosynthesis
LVEVVDDQRTALVFEPNAKEFAAAMLRLVTDECLRKRLGATGRREVEARFSAGRMVEGTIQVYEDVLKKRRAA